MAKRKLEEAMEEFLSWLPDWKQRSQLVEILSRVLASLPGGEEFEGLGYEPYDAISWKEFEMISNIFAAVDDKRDVEHAAEMLFEEEDEDE
jgi:hypothetical protein